MLNCYLNSELIRVSMAVKHCSVSYEREKKAKITSERFVQIGKMLSASRVIGFCLNCDLNRTHQIEVFTNDTETVAKEDCNWIFEKCAYVKPHRNADDAFNKTVYSLKKVSNDNVSDSSDDDAFDLLLADLDDDDDHYNKHPYREVFSELVKQHASIEISAGADGNKNTVVIALPDEMPLRVKAMIALALPGYEVIKSSETESKSDNHTGLDYDFIEKCVENLLDVLMRNVPMQREDNFEVSNTALVNSKLIDKIKIEDIDLSVRAFNCLKRAGINTIGDLRAMTEEELRQVRNLGMKCVDSIIKKLLEYNVTLNTKTESKSQKAEPPEENKKSAMEELDELIGLKNVKEQVKRIAAFARMKQDMEERQKAASPIVLNMEFTGNPGTAKTTVARILAKIFYEIGILNSKEIVEVGRADLVAGYVGQTAIKVKDVFEKAKGRLLFIDEAYSLADGQKGYFADEAINTIVQLMENNREDTVVIFAGYPNEMKDFFAANPGLRSRVPFRIEFPDYSTDEMVQITKLEAQKRGFAVSAEAEERVACICQKAVESTEKGNGRFCRNLVDSAILSFAERKYGDYCDTKEVINDFLLDSCDFEIPKALLIPDSFLPIGFTA